LKQTYRSNGALDVAFCDIKAEAKEPTVRDTYIILREPGCTPERKLPPKDRDGFRDFLRELVDYRPAGTSITIVRVGEQHGGMDCECGREWLSIFDRRWAKRSKKLFAHMSR
jgi:hypothetical protein